MPCPAESPCGIAFLEGQHDRVPKTGGLGTACRVPGRRPAPGLPAIPAALPGRPGLSVRPGRGEEGSGLCRLHASKPLIIVMSQVETVTMAGLARGTGTDPSLLPAGERVPSRLFPDPPFRKGRRVSQSRARYGTVRPDRLGGAAYCGRRNRRRTGAFAIA
jgi:hypothetical protein